MPNMDSNNPHNPISRPTKAQYIAPSFIGITSSKRISTWMSYADRITSLSHQRNTVAIDIINSKNSAKKKLSDLLPFGSWLLFISVHFNSEQCPFV